MSEALAVVKVRYHSPVGESETMSFEEAAVIAKEIGEALGGRQARALEVLTRYAERGRRATNNAMRSVGHVAHGAQHFAKAKEELDRGMEEIANSTRIIAKAVAADDDDRPTKPPPPEGPER